MRLLLASGDHALARGVAGGFAMDEVVTLGDLGDLGGLGDAGDPGGVGEHAGAGHLGEVTEPRAFAAVERLAPGAVVLVPDWTHDTTDEIRGCWWLARAAALAGVPTVLVSTAAVFDSADRRSRDEFAVPDPQTPVGDRAFSAEQIVQRTTPEAVIVRVGPTDVGTRALERLLVGSGVGVVGVIGGGVRAEAAGGGGAPAAGGGGAPGALFEPRGGETVVTPVAAAELGRVLRALTVGRRPGVFHVAGDGITLAAAAARLGVAPPPGGFRSAPPPLASVLCPMLQIPPPAVWAGAHRAADAPAETR